MKKTVESLNADIAKANEEYDEFDKATQAELAKIRGHLEEIAKEEKRKKAEHQIKVTGLQAERDALALAEKLKSFPKELVEGHKFCQVCGAEMRPFIYVTGDR